MDIASRIFLGFATLLFVATVLMIPYWVKKTDEWRTTCSEAGGVPYTPRDARICLNPTAIVELK
jgi:hypothetical protein